MLVAVLHTVEYVPQEEKELRAGAGTTRESDGVEVRMWPRPCLRQVGVPRPAD